MACEYALKSAAPTLLDVRKAKRFGSLGRDYEVQLNAMLRDGLNEQQHTSLPTRRRCTL